MMRRFGSAAARVALAGAILHVLASCEARDPVGLPNDAPSPLVVPGPAITTLHVAHNHTCEVREDGTLTCRGYYIPGTLTPPAGLAYTDSDGGFNHNCMVRSDGAVDCILLASFAPNFGQAPATYASPSGQALSRIGAGAYHNCALRADGAAECWGWNISGQAPAVRASPGGRPYTQVTGGYYHSCGLRDDGVMECWGDSSYGAPPTLSAPAGLAYAQISCGDYFTCALRTDGVVECIGSNSAGQAPPTRSALVGSFIQVSGGYAHACALRSDGVVECWGENASGQAPATRAAAGGLFFTWVGTGQHHSCGLRSDGFTECWGGNTYGQSGPPPTTMGVLPAATFVTPETAPEGSTLALALQDAHVPGYPEATSFTYAFNCGGGYGGYSVESTGSCPAGDGPANRTVWGRVRDQDGDSREYAAVVEVANVAPTIVSMTVPPTAVLEGGSALAEVSIVFSDPAGAADAPYTVAIDCGNDTGFSAAAGTCTYTEAGTYTVGASVTDKDGGFGTDSREIQVAAVIESTLGFDLSALPGKTFGDPGFGVASYASSNSPGAITFALGAGSIGCAVTPEGEVTITGVAIAANQCVIEASLEAHAGFTAAGPISQGFNIAKAPGSVAIANLPVSATYGGSLTLAYATAGDGAAASISLTPATCTVSAGAVSFDSVGTCTLQASVAEGTNHLAATGASQSLIIAPAATFLVIRLRAGDYSDPTLVLATVGWTPGGTQEVLTTAAGTIQFYFDGVAVGGPRPVADGSVLLTEPRLEEPGAYLVSAVFTSTDPNFHGASSNQPSAWLTIRPEQARVTWTGPEFVTTASASATSAVVPFSTTIRDITAVPGDAAHDTFPGDIRNARVAFVDGDTGELLCTDLVPVLVSAADATVATAGCSVPLGVGGTGARTYTIGTRVTGWYSRNQSSDNVTVTVAQPVNGMITGGGHLVNEASVGEYAGAAGLKTNFGFNVKYNKNMTNLQGAVNLIVRGEDGTVWQIKSTATSALTLHQPVNGAATFLGKANVTDITDPEAPVPLGGNLDLQVTMRDNGTPGELDLLGVTLRTAAGGLLFSSHWTGTATAQRNLRGGNLVVR
jgi:hypothetical protein